jgi:hypothetical protein
LNAEPLNYKVVSYPTYFRSLISDSSELLSPASAHPVNKSMQICIFESGLQISSPENNHLNQVESPLVLVLVFVGKRISIIKENFAVKSALDEAD